MSHHPDDIPADCAVATGNDVELTTTAYDKRASSFVKGGLLFRMRREKQVVSACWQDIQEGLGRAAEAAFLVPDEAIGALTDIERQRNKPTAFNAGTCRRH